MPAATIVPVAVKFTAFALAIVPVRFAPTLAPPAQVADTVPAIEVADCSVMSHFKSAQLPIGRPAIDEEAHAPEKAEAGVLLELVPPVDEDEDPGGVVLPATPVSPPGAVGVRSLEVFSNEQPVTSVEARNTAKTETFFMSSPTVWYRHTQTACAGRIDLFEIWKGRGGVESIAERRRAASGVKSDR